MRDGVIDQLVAVQFRDRLRRGQCLRHGERRRDFDGVRALPFGSLVLQLGHAAGHLGLQDGLQLLQQLRVGLLEEAGGELVQQAADVVGCRIEALRLLGQAARLQLHVLQRMLQHARHFRQRREPHGGGAACEGMGQRHRRIGQRSVQLQRPLLQRRDQPARPFVRFVEVDVVQRYADAQVLNDLDGLIDLHSRGCIEAFLRGHLGLLGNLGLGAGCVRLQCALGLFQDEFGRDIRRNEERFFL